VRAAPAIPFAAGDAAAAIAITVPPQSPPLAQRTSPHGQQPQQLEQGASNSGSFRAARRVASGASWHNFSLASMCGFANVHASPPQRGSSWRSGGGGAGADFRACGNFARVQILEYSLERPVFAEGSFRAHPCTTARGGGAADGGLAGLEVGVLRHSPLALLFKALSAAAFCGLFTPCLRTWFVVLRSRIVWFYA
jgi:hypothetical protein